MDIKIPNLKNLRSTELAGAVLNAGYKIPTLEMATRRAEKLCGALSIKAGERLPVCYGGHCGLLSCPRCRWQEQQLCMIKLLALVYALGGKRACRILNIVPEYGKTPIGELPNGGLRGFRDQTRAAIRKIDSEAVAALCVDISWERSAGQEEYWQWHLHGLMLKPEVKTLKQIHKRFAWKDKAGLKASCYRPVHTKKIDELVGWLTKQTALMAAYSLFNCRPFGSMEMCGMDVSSRIWPGPSPAPSLGR